jgi:eukaryotic-like serine/threonine-protein kinase
MPGKVTLSVIAGPLEGTQYEFDSHDTFIFGRAPDCHAQLAQDDAAASRHHFLLEVNPPDARLRDLGSLNGTHVNGIKHGGRGRDESPEQAAERRRPEVDLKDGDQIRVGATMFQVTVRKAPTCMACGAAIAAADEEKLAWVGDTFLCGTCRERAQAPAAPAPVPAVAATPERDFCVSFQRDTAGVLVALCKAPSAGVKPPRTIAGYDIERLLGKGGMGAVYLTRQRGSGRVVALKVMLAQVDVDEHSRETFKREINITRALKHHNIVELYEQGSAGNGFYFVMEYCPGGSVLDLMDTRRSAVPIPLAIRITLAALDGLVHAHEHGFVHRDIKPENILLTDAAGSDAKVSDFGLAKSFQQGGLSGMTATGAFGGTYQFMPREQLTHFRELRPVSDVWSLGATLYFMLTKRYARDFLPEKDPLQVILKGGVIPIRNRDPRIPEALAAVVDHAVADKIEDRFASARELRAALERCQG